MSRAQGFFTDLYERLFRLLPVFVEIFLLLVGGVDEKRLLGLVRVPSHLICVSSSPFPILSFPRDLLYSRAFLIHQISRILRTFYMHVLGCIWSGGRIYVP